MNKATESSGFSLSRRGAMKTTAGLTAAGVGMGAGFSGSAAGGLAEGAFQRLQTDGSNIVTEDGDEFRIRGINIPDPKRLNTTAGLRGKNARQLLGLVTNNERGWHPRAVRIPAQPQDIGEHPMGHAGPEYEDGELESPDVVADDRRKMRPPQPKAFDEDQLTTYMDEHYQPMVELCAERGVYCIVDYHRHWHEQPPGDPEKSDAAAENHLPYNSDYTNYWARNTYSGSDVEFTEDDPGSWGHVDQTWIDAHGYGQFGNGDSPYEAEHWQVNEPLLEEVQMFWEEAVDRFGDMDHVIFEPYNEPTSPGLWGPAQGAGCGSDKQEGLWMTFQDDFMGPIIDTIRDGGYDDLLLVGVPGWCQSLQGLTFRDFNEAGYDNIACTWHNYAGHDVSQMHNWFNDTDYQSPSGVESDTGQALDNPYLPPPDSVDDEACWGWEGYEAAGLQGAMEHHHIAVTEFGWTDSTEVSHWLRGNTTGQGTTNFYGEPFMTAIQDEPRMSWTGWVADVRWHPTMFAYEPGAAEGSLDLTNDNFYDTIEDPDNSFPEPCEEPPCEWTLKGNPESGEYVKSQLAEYSDDAVPFETTTHGPLGDGPGPEDCEDLPTETVDGQTVCDVNDDGYYRDVTGDGEVGQGDVAEFFQKQHRSEWKQPDLFDFSGNGDVTHGDVVDLFDYVALN